MQTSVFIGSANSFVTPDIMKHEKMLITDGLAFSNWILLLRIHQRGTNMVMDHVQRQPSIARIWCDCRHET
jgi:hypothetical protein